ncbi:NHL repeat containing protein [Methylocapsa aurea]|uniref:NHL repeat containing protein n=1 Tax=Methylocapsa aurea TaxID=663610 RepID=UPI00055CB365|nr:NHL repeat containing protein [Methylocapsa aurea]
MRVSLRALAEPLPGDSAAAPPLLDPAGPEIVLGSTVGGFDLTTPVAASTTTMFGPRGAALAGAEGPLFVADTGHHRLLVWRRRPIADHAPADFLIGQPDFAHEGRNAKGEPGAATLNVPTGVAASGEVLAVADAWNHRVLIWRGLPEANNQPADVVLGQADFGGMLANRGGEVGADTLNWCYGVSIVGQSLIVCDTGNRRVLLWHEIPTANGTPADLVLGQGRMDCRDENGGIGVDARGMRWPHSAAVAGETLLVADSGNNRVMVWRGMPRQNGAPADFLIGQINPSASEHNRANYRPDAASLNMPYACAVMGNDILVADTANSRLLGFAISELATGAPARAVHGQPDFQSKGDNRWRTPVRDSLCWPYGVTSVGDAAVVADSGNNRVMLWRAAS